MREYRLYLQDIENAIAKIEAYIRDIDYSSFAGDAKTLDSVLYNMQIIGEAANRVPIEVREKHADIDWRGIIGMRNVIVHGYFTVDPDTVWKTVKEDLPLLLKQIKKIE